MKAAVALFLALAAGFVALAVYGKYQKIKTEFREEQARERAEQERDLREDTVNDAGDGAVP
jgi:hypothetical protein